MKGYLALTAAGVAVLDEGGGLISFRRFEGDPAEVAEKIAALEGGTPVPEVVEAVREGVGKGLRSLVVEDEELGRRIGEEVGVGIEVEPGNEVVRGFREGLDKYLAEVGIEPGAYRELVRSVSVELARRKVRRAAEKRDLFVAQAISSIDDVNKTINLFASRIREWYSLHFPELDELVDDHEDYVTIVNRLGHRANITEEALKELGIEPRLARKIAEAAKTSMGADITDFDAESLRALAGITVELYNLRRRLEEYVDEAMKEVAPNVRGLVGPLLGARLIALAGGLQKLATLPASTIQVLGAEKALFRALRTGGKPPKHGVIFQFPAIHRSPRWQRGKIARALAAKLAIAARIDAFTGEYKADALREELEKRIKEIKTLYAKPPAVKRERGRRGRRRRRR